MAKTQTPQIKIDEGGVYSYMDDPKSPSGRYYLSGPQSNHDQVDAQGRHYTDAPGQGKRYDSPMSWGGTKPEDTTGIYRHGPQWDSQKGEWVNPIDWGNIANTAVGVYLTAGGANIAMNGSRLPTSIAAERGGTSMGGVLPGGGTTSTVAKGMTTLDKLNTAGKVVDYGAKLFGSRSQGKADKSAQAWEQQAYAAQVKLLAEQRLEDQQLAREKLARDEAKWNAQQAEIKRQSDLEDTQYAESEARKAPYRAGGLQTLARLNAASQPTVTPYESRFMGQR